MDIANWYAPTHCIGYGEEDAHDDHDEDKRPADPRERDEDGEEAALPVNMAPEEVAPERLYRVAYVETNREEQDVRNTFTQCGEMSVSVVLSWCSSRCMVFSLMLHIVTFAYSRAIYPVKLGDRQKREHFFIEFADQASVKRGRALQLPDVKVHVLAYSQLLIDQFLAIAPALPSDLPASTSMKEAGGHRFSPHIAGMSPMRKGGKHCAWSLLHICAFRAYIQL